MKAKAKNVVSDKTAQEADKIAKGTQKPGQTKEQTKLIAQGIKKGIDTYKKQQKSKARELDKQLKKAKRPLAEIDQTNAADLTSNKSSSQLIPWGLMIFSWVGFAVYLLMNR
ncbi:MAG: hypothetical protein ACJA0E_001980 [Bermanella sp.]|jgi:hypothetical protein